jgi:hypothetical protein
LSIKRKQNYILAIGVPLLKLLAAPLRNVKVTGPDVVGFQVKVAGWPAVIMKLEGTVGRLEVLPLCATAVAIRQARKDSGARCMVVAIGCALLMVKGANCKIGKHICSRVE